MNDNIFLCCPESLPDLFEYSPGKDCNGNPQEYGSNGRLEEFQEASVRILHAPDQVLLYFLPEYQTQDQRCLGIFVLAHEVTDDPESQRSPDIEHIVVGAIGPHHAQDENNGEQDVFGHIQDP